MDFALKNKTLKNFSYNYIRGISLSNYTFVVLSISVILSGLATYFVLSSGMIAKSTGTVLVLLNIDIFLVLTLGILLVRRIAQIRTDKLSGQSGSKLHVRIAILFGFVAITPSILMMIFAVLFFSLGVESWFSQRVRTALIDSSEVADAYLTEHIQIIRADALAVANDINRQWAQLNNSDLIDGFLSSQAVIRDLTEIIIFRSDMQVIAKAGYTFALQSGEEIPLSSIAQANLGDVAILTGESGDRVRALLRLDPLTDSYLFIGRFIDPKVLNRVERTQDAVDEYLLLEDSRFEFQINFTLLFILFSILLLLISVWFGLNLANKLATPIVSLIKASELVRSGDFSVRVKEKTQKEETDEIDKLSSAFNRMTSTLSTQRKALLDANVQLDERRLFTEAVLSGVTAGVIGVDNKGLITLPNKAASFLINHNLEKYIGYPLEDFIPEFKTLLNKDEYLYSDSIQKEIKLIVKDKKRTFLVRSTVEVKDDNIIGYVFTFDDITALQAAERKAAWSGVARRIAHEIKNPLTPIQLSAERLKRKFENKINQDNDVFQKCTDTIIHYVGEIGDMVDEFTQFARMPQPNLKKNDLNKLCKNFVRLIDSTYTDIQIKVTSTNNDLCIMCDVNQINRSLANVVKNSAESISEKIKISGKRYKGFIEIILLDKGNKVFLIVNDNGVGLPDNDFNNYLTEPYVTTRPNGTGLGLAIVHKIIEDHNGEIIIENNKENGASITFIFNKV